MEKNTATQQSKPEEVYAIRGKLVIDLIDSDTGFTQIYGKTLAECQAEYPKDTVERMTLSEFCEAKAKAQDVPITWSETTEDKYFELLEVLPPSAMANGCFLVGEPWDHHAKTGQPRYQAVAKCGNQYSISNRPLTRAEFVEAVELLTGRQCNLKPGYNSY